MLQTEELQLIQYFLPELLRKPVAFLQILCFKQDVRDLYRNVGLRGSMDNELCDGHLKIPVDPDIMQYLQQDIGRSRPGQIL